ncbi:MAG TPA: hypothetical protein VJ486_06520 [Geothrix sp.]|nr:hypothetical protein [Geothrix sp.]
MHTVIRTYRNHPALADELAKHSPAIEAELGSVSGFVSYELIKTPQGAVAITVCEDARGCDESTRRAGDWLSRNLPTLNIPTPEVYSGKVIFRFSKAPALV